MLIQFCFFPKLSCQNNFVETISADLNLSEIILAEIICLRNYFAELNVSEIKFAQIVLPRQSIILVYIVKIISSKLLTLGRDVI
jgi:hypothetical protein